MQGGVGEMCDAIEFLAPAAEPRMFSDLVVSFMAVSIASLWIAQSIGSLAFGCRMPPGHRRMT